MIDNNNIDTVWVCETVNPKIRFESVGKPVPINAPVLIKHVFTGQWLGCDYPYMYSTDTGSE